MASARSMDIFFLSRVFSPGSRHGGSLTDQVVLGQQLLERGHRVRIVTSDLFEPGTRYAGAALHEHYRGLEVIRLRSVLRYRWDAIVRGAYRTLRELTTRESVITAFGVRHYLALVAFSVGKTKACPLFSIPQGGIPPRHRFPVAKSLWDVTVGRRILRDASTVIATSEPEFDDLLNWGLPERVVAKLPPFGEILPRPSLARGDVRRKLGVGQNGMLLVWAGRIHPIKGLDLLVRALSGYPQLSSVTVVLMGDDAGDGERKKLERLVRAAGLSRRVLFLGWCNEDTRANVYGASDAFVLPSRSESFNRSAAEALMLGCPLIAAETCGITRHVGEATLVFRRSESALASAIIHFDSMADTRYRLAEGCSRVAERLHPKWAGTFLEKLYLSHAR